MKFSHFPAVAVVVGIALLLLSLVLPALARRSHDWNADKAQALQRTANQMHEHSHADATQEDAAGHGSPQDPSVRQRYEELRQELEGARSAGRTAALVFRWSGTALILLGVASFIAVRREHQP